MILPKPQDAVHKAWLYRLLIALIDNPKINQLIFFKGGTCASMLGYLDRFSIDLDFDLSAKADINSLRPHFHKTFKKLGLKVRDESKKVLQFFLKYPAPMGKRNTLKLDIIDRQIKANKYQSFYLREIDRYMVCQTVETMFAHKLVSAADRFKKHKTIAARDMYDVHYFFLQGFRYEKKVIEQRTKLSCQQYLKKLVKFINNKINQKALDQDLNTLLPQEKFLKLRKVLKTEVLIFIKDEIKRFKSFKL